VPQLPPPFLQVLQVSLSRFWLLAAEKLLLLLLLLGVTTWPGSVNASAMNGGGLMLLLKEDGKMPKTAAKRKRIIKLKVIPFVFFFKQWL